MNKKGFIGDMLSYTILLFGIGIVILCVWIFLKDFNTAWQANGNIPAESKSIIAYQTSKFPAIWEGFIIMAVIGYIIAIVVAAFMIRSHPAFAAFAFLLLIIIGVVSVYLSNVYYDFETSDTISPYSVSFTKMNFWIEKLPFLVAGMGILFIIVLYAKSGSSGVSL